MKKKHSGKCLLASVICTVLSMATSCSSEASMTDDGSSAMKTYTFSVSEGNDESDVTRAAIAPQTVTKDLGDGMMLEGVLTEEPSAPATRTTTTSTIADGTGVTYYVCDASGLILRTGSTSISGGALSVSCPANSSTIYFCIGASLTAAGNNISTVTGSITPSSTGAMTASVAVTSSSTITFHRVTSSAKVTMASSDGSTIGDFSTTLSGLGCTAATLCGNGSYTAGATDQTITCAYSGSASTSVSGSYVSFLPKTPSASSSVTLALNSITFAGTAKTYSTNNTMTFSGTFKQSAKYNFTVTLKKSAINSTTNTLWDGKYYQWDAPTGTTYTENGSYNSTTVNSAPETDVTNVATAGCKDCPTYKQMLMYLGAGVYYDTYTTWKEANGTLHTGGIWLKKSSLISGFSTNSAATTTSANYAATITSSNYGDYESVRTSGEYFFLPAAGYYISRSLVRAGTYGYYWSSTPNSSTTNAWLLLFDSSSAHVSYLYRSYGFCLWAVQ